MVEFAPNSTTTASSPDGLVHASSKLKNAEPFDSFDSKAIDYSLADSFLDFDSLNDWIDELTSPVMVDTQTVSDSRVETSVPFLGEVQPIVQASGEDFGKSKDFEVHPIAQGSGEDCGTSKDLNCIIEEGMSKVSLVIDGGSNGNIELEESLGDDRESDVESEGTRSSSTSSSSSSLRRMIKNSSSSSSDNDNSCDDQEVEKELTVKANGHSEIGELEEGEIREFDDEDKDEVAFADDMVAWDGEDLYEEDEEAGIEAGPISSKNELKDLPPVPQVHETLEPHHQMLPVGVVLSIMGNQVIVEGVEKHNPLNEGSILWITESRSPLGLVDEIFGPVKNPYYSVRYNSESEIPTGISGGSHVSFVLEFSDYVLNNKDLYKKGYDASGMNDEEVTDEDEFSDDEKELEFKRMQKFSKRAMNDNNQQMNGNRNNGNGRKKKNNTKGRKFDQRTFETAPDESRKYGQPTPQQATVPEGSRFDQHAPQQTKMDMVQPSPNQNQLTGGPPLAPFAAYHGGCPNPSAAQHGFMNGNGAMPSFPPAYNPCFTPAMNGIRPNEMLFQFQQQQNPFFPNGFPMNGMPWLIPNPAQQMPQMPMLNTFPGAAYPPGFVGNNPSTSIGAQGFHFGGQQFGQNQNVQQPATHQFNQNLQQPASQQFNQNVQQPTTPQFNQNGQQPAIPQFNQNVQQPATPQFNQNVQQPATPQFNQNAQQPATPQFNQNAQQPATPQFNQNMPQPATPQFNQNMPQPATQQFNQNMPQPATQQFNQNLQQPATQQFNPANSQPPAGNVAPRPFNQGSSPRPFNQGSSPRPFNQGSSPQAFNQGSSPQAFNQGPSSNQGRRSYGRGRGGQFRGRRGGGRQTR